MSSTPQPESATIKEIERIPVQGTSRVILWVQHVAMTTQLPIRVERELDYHIGQVIKVVVPVDGRGKNGNIIRLALAPA